MHQSAALQNCSDGIGTARAVGTCSFRTPGHTRPKPQGVVLFAAAGRQRAQDDADAAAGAEELSVIKSAENMVCAGVCERDRSESGWKGFNDCPRLKILRRA